MAGRFVGAIALVLLSLTTGIASTAQSQPWSSPSTAFAPERAVQKSSSSVRRPSVAIVTPKAGSTVRGRTVEVSVSVKGFEVVRKQFQPAVANEGHVHFYLDVKMLPARHTYPSPVHYHSISATSYTWTGVSPGRHTFAAQLVGNDHVPLRPRVADRVTVTVR